MSLAFEEISIKQIENIIRVVNDCSDTFNYVFDLKNDTFYISRDVKNAFGFVSENFDNAAHEILKIVHPEDRSLILNEIDLLKTGRKSEHSLEYRWINKSGKPVWILSRAKILPSSTMERRILIGQISVARDEDKTDLLTGLASEAQLRSDFAAIWTRKQSVSGFILKIDVDNLGAINEQYGVATGDLILAKIGDSCRKVCSGIAKPYKSGSDEFICMNLTGKSAPIAQKMFQDLKREINEVGDGIGLDVLFNVSGGAVAFLNDNSQLDDLIKKCDFAVMLAKKNGRNTFMSFNANKYSAHLRALDIQEKLRESIRNNFQGFQLYYQPVIDAHKLFLDSENTVQNVIGAEALIRFTCPEYGMLSPEEFVPILERTGMIVSVGRWILRTAFSQCRDWNRLQKNFRMSVNLSYVQVQKSDVLRDVETALLISEVNPGNITIELTESGYIDNGAQLQELTENFARLGLNVDIDDFGTGYSNLRYLQYLKANTLKLDYTFVQKATGGDEGDKKIIKHITQMAHELGMKVCMEGVETEEDIEKLLIYNPDKFQGFHFGRPCNETDFREHHIKLDVKRDIYEKQAAVSE